MFFGRYGVIFANGNDWKLQRRLFLEVLKSSGFGRGVIEQSINCIWPQMKAIMDKSTEKGNLITSKAFDMPLLEFLVYTFSDPSIFPNGIPQEALDCFNISRYFNDIYLSIVIKLIISNIIIINVINYYYS